MPFEPAGRSLNKGRLHQTNDVLPSRALEPHSRDRLLLWGTVDRELGNYVIGGAMTSTVSAQWLGAHVSMGYAALREGPQAQERRS